MHNIIPILLFLPFTSQGFGVKTFPGPRRSQALNNFILEFFDDHFSGDESAEKSLAERIARKTLARFLGDEKNLKEDPNDEVYWEVKKDGIFGYVPDKEMTGVEPHLTRLCSTLSSQLYKKKAKGEFQLSTKDHKTDLLIYDNHGSLNMATVPFAVAVCGKTMILGWRGTGQLLDMLNDAAASPQSSIAWRKHAKTIKAQGAFTSIVQNDITNHEADIIKEAKKRGITEILTTGQSLGGGAAQIAHLILRAQIQDESSPWAELEGVNVRSVAFCGPMTTVLINNASPETDAFVGELIENSCNMVYSNDVVPRAYGYLTFCEDFVDNVVDSKALSKMIPLPRILKGLLDTHGRIEDLVEDGKDHDAVEQLVTIFSQYRHIGNIVYYESEDSKPRVLRDMGAFYKNSLNKKDILRDVEYKDVRNPIDEFMGWHMDIIHGPGLSYPPEELMK